MSELLAELQQEGIRKEENVTYFKGKMGAYQGKLYLTDKRLALTAKSMASNINFGGLIGGIISAIIRRKSADVVQLNLQLEDIQSFEQGKIGLNKNVLIIKDKEGNEHKIGVRKYAPWEELLNAKPVEA